MQKLFHESLVSLTYLTQSPFRLCNHAATYPEKLLCESRYGCFVPEFWGAHNGWGGRIPGAWGLFGLVEGASSQRGGEHPCWQRSQRLKGGLLGWAGQWLAAAQSWGHRCHRWCDVHPWIVHLSPTILSHRHCMNPPSSLFCSAPLRRLYRTASLMWLLKYQHILLLKLKCSPHGIGGTIFPSCGFILRHPLLSGLAQEPWILCYLLFFFPAEKRLVEEVCNMCQSLNLPQAVILEGGFSPAFMEGFSRYQ